MMEFRVHSWLYADMILISRYRDWKLHYSEIHTAADGSYVRPAETRSLPAITGDTCITVENGRTVVRCLFNIKGKSHSFNCLTIWLLRSWKTSLVTQRACELLSCDERFDRRLQKSMSGHFTLFYVLLQPECKGQNLILIPIAQTIPGLYYLLSEAMIETESHKTSFWQPVVINWRLILYFHLLRNDGNSYLLLISSLVSVPVPIPCCPISPKDLSSTFQCYEYLDL